MSHLCSHCSSSHVTSWVVLTCRVTCKVVSSGATCVPEGCKQLEGRHQVASHFPTADARVWPGLWVSLDRMLQTPVPLVCNPSCAFVPGINKTTSRCSGRESCGELEGKSVVGFLQIPSDHQSAIKKQVSRKWLNFEKSEQYRLHRLAVMHTTQRPRYRDVFS